MRWWLRFQLGLSALSLLNLSLLSISVAPVIGKYLGCRAIYVLVALPMVAFVAVLSLGWLMDRVGWAQRMDRESTARSGTWARLFEQLDRIERRSRQ